MSYLDSGLLNTWQIRVLYFRSVQDHPREPRGFDFLHQCVQSIENWMNYCLLVEHLNWSQWLSWKDTCGGETTKLVLTGIGIYPSDGVLTLE